MVKLKILFDFIFCPIRQLYPVLLLDEEHSYLEGKTCHLSHPSSVGQYIFNVLSEVYIVEFAAFKQRVHESNILSRKVADGSKQSF